MSENTKVVSGLENLTVPRHPDLVIAPGDPASAAGTYRHIVILPGAEMTTIGTVRTTDGLRILSPASDHAFELLAMLRSLEWSGRWETRGGVCPICTGYNDAPAHGHGPGHATGCALAALLARAGG